MLVSLLRTHLRPYRTLLAGVLILQIVQVRLRGGAVHLKARVPAAAPGAAGGFRAGRGPAQVGMPWGWRGHSPQGPAFSGNPCFLRTEHAILGDIAISHTKGR